MSHRAQLDDLKIDHADDNDPSSGRRPALWGGLALVAALVVVVLWWRSQEAPVAVRTAAVTETKSGSRPTVLNASGYVIARRQATVSSKITARIVEVLIEEGMEVSEGEMLARLDDATQQRALALAEAQATAADSVREETRVRRHEARLELDRTLDLVAREVSSQAELDRNQAEFDALGARLEAQEDELDVARRELALRRQDVADTEIRAPFDGIVVTKNAQPGEMISPISAGGGFTRTGIGTIVDMTSLEIEVDVNEAYINRVRDGQSVEATLDAYPEWLIPARVITIVPTADRQKATVRVRIGFETLDERILPDMGVKVAFFDDGLHTTTSARRTIVPREALRREGDLDVVLVIVRGIVERRAVRVGGAFGDDVEVITGVTAGERVVVEGPDTLADGTTVEETKS